MKPTAKRNEVKIRDVARVAGVSPATVSRVLNGTARVLPVTEQKVHDAIRETGFLVNGIAKSLKSNRSQTVGFVCADMKSTMVLRILEPLERDLLRMNYSLLIVNSNNDPALERRQLRTLMERRVDALICFSIGQNEDYLYQLHQSGFPLLVFDRRPLKYNLPYLSVDKGDGMFQALAYLYALGHRRIATITGEQWLATNIDRFMGLDCFVQNKGLDKTDFPVLYGTFSEQFGYDAMYQVFAMQPKPTAIIGGAESISMGILHYCYDRNICIPQDFSLISFGGVRIAEIVPPHLTTVGDWYQEASERITEWLRLALAGDSHARTYQCVVKPKLRIGGSCAEIVSK